MRLRPIEPIDYGAKGGAVSNLHAALLFLINDRNIDQQTQRTLVRRLEDEWVYRHHPEDWETYQTRYVSDDVFDDALRNMQ